MMERRRYKALNFDLDTNALRQVFPKDYRQGYREIKRFLEQNGFEHKQYSGYRSVQAITEAELLVVIRSLNKKCPWLSTCAKHFDATNIGYNYDLKELVFGQFISEKELLNAPEIDLSSPPSIARSEVAKENIKERDAQHQSSVSEKPLKPKKREPER